MSQRRLQIALIVLVIPWSAVGKSKTDLVFERCHLSGSLGIGRFEAECTTFQMPENPREPEGKTIDLFVARVPVLARDPEPSPLVFIAGGPGQASTHGFVDIASAFQSVLRDRSILLIDQRGPEHVDLLEAVYKH